MSTEMQKTNEEEQRASSSCQEDQASGCQAPGMTQGFDSELGLTVEKLSTALDLPAEFFKGLGVSDKKQQGIHVVTVPYLDENRELAGIKLLQSLYNGGRFEKPPLRVLPYGFWRIPEIKKHGTVILVPSEKDCWVCWHSGIPVLGLPNSDNGSDKWLDHLRDLEVFLWDGNLDRGFLPLMDENLPGLQVLTAPDDTPSLWGAYAQGKDLQTLIGKAKERVSLACTVLQTCRESRNEELRQAAMSILTADDPLLVIQEAIRSLGYGGDIKAAMVTYLAATSRVLGMRHGSMPVHLLLKGPPSSGKSYTVKIIKLLLPKEAYHEIVAGSPRVLIYGEDDLRHRVVIFSEADSLPKGEDNPAASALRSLMTENQLDYQVTITDASTGLHVVQEISKPGPSVVVTTSTQGLGPQLDSRVFTIEMSDSSEQIQAALATQAQLELEGVVEPDPALIAFQALLQIQAPWEAVVPFVDKLAKKMGLLPQASRINRDFARLLSLIKVVAVLRHHQREVDNQQRIIATIDDYAVVYSLVNKVYETSVTKVSDTVRWVIVAVGELKQRGTSPISQSKVARHLGISRQTVNHPVHVALKQGWLVNAETRKGYPDNLDLGEPLPEALGLPTLADLVAEESEDVCGPSLDTLDTIETSDTTSDAVSDSQYSSECYDELSPKVVNLLADGDSESISQANPLTCAVCGHLKCGDWDDGNCRLTNKYFLCPNEEHPCEHFKLKQRSDEALSF